MIKKVGKRNLYQIYQQLWKVLSFKRKRQVFGAFILIIFSALAEMFSILSIYPLLRIITSKKDILDDRLLSKFSNILVYFDSDFLIFVFTLFFIFSVLLNAILKLSNIYYSARLIAALGDDFGAFVFDKTIHSSYEEKVKQNSSEIIASINSHVPSTITGIEVALNIVSYSITSSFILIGMTIISWKITCLSLFIFSLIYFVILNLLKKRAYRYGKLISEANISIVKFVQESFGSIREIIIDNTFLFHKKRFKNINKLRYVLNAKSTILTSSPRYFIETATLSSIALFAYYYSKSSLNSNYFLPALGSLALGMQKLLPALQQVYSALMNLSVQNYPANMTLDVLEGSRKTFTENLKSEELIFKDKITFEDVSFYYDKNKTVLKNLSFDIFKGQKIGVVGETGSGKSTLIDLILGLLTPTKGNIYVDQRRLHNENQQFLVNWRSIISHVSQQIYLTDTNYAENIAFGLPVNEIDINKVKKVSEIALIKDLIESSKYKYFSPVGERGIQLSGGQLQRIGIARALYKNSQVLVLDEATSALDNKTEKKLMKSIIDNYPKLTYVIIAHRLSTITNCDLLIHIKDGLIYKIGKPIDIISDLTK